MNFVAIIPSLGALGPLGLLALIAPAAFAALMLWMRRWKAALGAASAMTTVFLFQAWWQAPLRPTWFSTRAGLWAVLAGLAGTFFVWALNRPRPAKPSDSSFDKGDRIAVGTAMVVTGFCAAYMVIERRWSESLGLAAIVVFTSTLAAWITLLTSRVPERGLLIALTIGCAGISMFETVRAAFTSELRVEWMFEADRAGAFLDSPLVAGNRIFIGTAHHEGLHQDGEVCEIDGTTGRKVWSWRGNPELRPIYGTPAYAEGRLYLGEGLHSDRGCRLRCLDLSAKTPTELWSFETGSHIESSPVLNAARVYFGAGDDGIYCVDALNGKQIWHLEGLHIDATPLVQDGVLYVGSYRAEDNQHKDLRLLALKAEDGAVIWSKPIDLSSYSQPAIVDKTVYFTLGTGDIESNGPQLAGAVVAVNADSGKLDWRTELPDSVFGSPAFFYDIVLVACRNGTICAVKRTDGRIQWQFEVGAPVIAAPTIVHGHGGSFALVVSRAGRCVRLNVWSGAFLDEIDLVRAAHADSGQFISAALSEYLSGAGKRIFIAGSVMRGLREAPILYCIPSNY